MTITNETAGVNAYTNACLFNPSIAAFEALLDDEVQFTQTNENEEVSTISGKAEVVKVFDENLFKITTDIFVRKLNIQNTPHRLGASFNLDVVETKNNFRGIEGKSTWHILDDSSFLFKESADGTLRIAAIFSKVVIRQI